MKNETCSYPSKMTWWLSLGSSSIIKIFFLRELKEYFFQKEKKTYKHIHNDR